jgi:hypothetical protein
MVNKWDKKPWKENVSKWKDNTEKWKLLETDDLFVFGSTIFLFASTQNEEILADAGKMEKIGQEILAIYSANGVNWLNKIRVINDKSMFNQIINKLTYTDAVLDYTDDKSLGDMNDTSMLTLQSKFASGKTRGFFKAYIYVGATAAINSDQIYQLAYSGAHELLHQLVSRIGYALYANMNYYQAGEHYNNCELLSSAGYLDSNCGGVQKPDPRGSGIEKIPLEMINDVRNYRTDFIRLGKLASKKVQTSMIARYTFIIREKERFDGTNEDIVNNVMIKGQQDQSKNIQID